jgi:hypothetical protein
MDNTSAASRLSIGSFTKAFVAKLIELGETAIYPKSEADRRGFAVVVQTLNGEIERLRNSSDPDDKALYRSLVVLRNQIQASSTGAFDAFETALRNLQLSFTNSPNPFYEEIGFTISRPFAESIFSEFPPAQKKLIGDLAEKFRNARRIPITA